MAAAITIAYKHAPDGFFETIVAWARSNPVAGGLLYVLFVSIATVLFLPGSVSMMLGGFLFGVFTGSFLAMIGIVVGALVLTVLYKMAVGVKEEVGA